jgi:hypothetical protein
MARVPLERIAWGRSGDKGEASNLGVVARSPAAWAWLHANLSAELVASALSGIVRGTVVRYELPNLGALNFILHGSLGGGGAASLLTDAQGKTHGQGLLRLEIDVPAELLP